MKARRGLVTLKDCTASLVAVVQSRFLAESDKLGLSRTCSAIFVSTELEMESDRLLRKLDQALTLGEVGSDGR